jgi:hypothetical protein
VMALILSVLTNIFFKGSGIEIIIANEA